MNEFVKLLLAALIFCPVLHVFSGAGECRTRTLKCYDCDTRNENDTFCEHVNRSNPDQGKPDIKPCRGCCVKFHHNYPNGSLDFVQRTCTEHIDINYFMVDHVCMREGKGRGHMCFCEDDLCNAATPHFRASILQNPIFASFSSGIFQRLLIFLFFRSAFT